MTPCFNRTKKPLTYRIFSAFIALTFGLNCILPSSLAYAQGTSVGVMNLPVPGTAVPLTQGFTPARIIAMTIHQDNPLMFDFMVDPGDSGLTKDALNDESLKLVKYFLASLTVPADKLWVNLSPYEKDRIILPEFAATEMGAELLAQDYLLKQLTASLMNPEDQLGKRFWDRVYTKAQKIFGTTNIPFNTFNKIWIIPDRAVVHTNGLSVFVIESRFKVMMEEDYLSLQHHSAQHPDASSEDVVSGLSSSIIKEVLLPEITKEVNEGKTFAQLRQIYNSLILATWYKQNLKDSLLGQIYADKVKINGLTVEDKDTSQKIYEQYLAALQKGVHNFIKEDYDPPTQQIIPRKYFSGGVNMAGVSPRASSPVALGEFNKNISNATTLTIGLDSPNDPSISYGNTAFNPPPPQGQASSPIEPAQDEKSTPIQSAQDEKSTYFFGVDKDGRNHTEGDASMVELLGGKGAGLAEMSRMTYQFKGETKVMPVPAGFTITTAESPRYYANDRELRPELIDEIMERIAQLERVTGKSMDAGKSMGGDEKPLLLVSVRSGARISMPGMMDTILNIGLTDVTVEVFARQRNNSRAAYDLYRRLIQMFGETVFHIEKKKFDSILNAKKEERRVKHDTDLKTEDLREVVHSFKLLFSKETGRDFPQTWQEQVELAVGKGVFESDQSKKAMTYRKLHGISYKDTPTSATVVEMVYGNLGETSGTGVAFTRDPNTGEEIFYGEVLFNAQGEDVVAGIRTPLPINKKGKEMFLKNHPELIGQDIKTLEEKMPDVYAELVVIYKVLERHFKDMQDLEFTIEDGKLYMLQRRNGKRAAVAALNIAMDLFEEGLIDEQEAVMRLNSDQINQLLHPSLDPSSKEQAIKEERLLNVRGLPASPGAAVGAVVFDSEEAERLGKQGQKVILVREETSPEDIGGMAAAQGIITRVGGLTSHAAVVGRGMGKPIIVAAQAIAIYEDHFMINNIRVNKGDVISFDGTTGEVFLGEIETRSSIVLRGFKGETLESEEETLSQRFKQFIKWVDKYRGHVRTNAETENDIKWALRFGADGIGLARTEHMFFEKENDRLYKLQKMILSNNLDSINDLAEFQQKDFEKFLELLEGRPATVRLIDPPVHEFVSNLDQATIERLAKDLGTTKDAIIDMINEKRDPNPMSGMRGSRLGMAHPKLIDMQVGALFDAYLAKKGQIEVAPLEIMTVFMNNLEEFIFFEERIERLAKARGLTRGEDYFIGTMIETPSAALDAERIATHADFFSFGSNDLTQFTFFFSRDDTAGVVTQYRDKEILNMNPFESIDPSVAELMNIAVAKVDKKGFKSGCCGEHGGDFYSVDNVLVPAGIYPSASPFRIILAKLASAQRNIKLQRQDNPKTAYDLQEIKTVPLTTIKPSVVYSINDIYFHNTVAHNYRKSRARLLVWPYSTEEIKKKSANDLAESVKKNTQTNIFSGGTSEPFIELSSFSLHHLFDHITDAEIADMMTKNEITDDNPLASNHRKNIERLSHEQNPDFGNRGPRLAHTGYDAILRAELKGIFRGMKQSSFKRKPRIIVPLVIDAQEFLLIRDLIDEVAKEEEITHDQYSIGASIATARASLLAGKIAEEADFIIFNTMILTESMLGMTREGAGPILEKLAELKIYPESPFEVMPPTVKKMVEIGMKRAQKTRPKIPIYFDGENARIGSASSPVGGIDLNPGNMDLKTNDREGNRIQLPMPKIPLESIKIDGLVPIIIHVAPVTNLPLLLGISSQTESNDTTLQYQPQPSPIDTPRRFRAEQVEEIGLLN